MCMCMCCGCVMYAQYSNALFSALPVVSVDFFFLVLFSSHHLSSSCHPSPALFHFSPLFSSFPLFFARPLLLSSPCWRCTESTKKYTHNHIFLKHVIYFHIHIPSTPHRLQLIIHSVGFLTTPPHHPSSPPLLAWSLVWCCKLHRCNSNRAFGRSCSSRKLTDQVLMEAEATVW